MIVVTIELHSAITGAKKKLGTMVICNTGSGSNNPKRGDYAVRVGQKNKQGLKDVMADPLRKGSVYNYPRLSYNVWRLVSRAIRSAFPEENR